MKKITLSPAVVGLLFLVVLILLILIIYAGSKQTQVYRSRAAYPYPSPTIRKPTPTRTPTPIPQPGDHKVIGSTDTVSCSVISGWGGDKDDPYRAIRVRIYADGDKEHGKLLNTIRANIPRESAVCKALGGSNCNKCPADLPQCRHGFSLNVPQNLKDGATHQIYVYGLNLAETPGKDRLLDGAKTITCAIDVSPTPTITPTAEPIPECPRKGQGDANCDGVIDGVDYVIWLNSQCVAIPPQVCADIKADFNFDTKINDDDYKIWFNNRGT